MKRRTFIQGAVAAAVSAAIPGTGDGVSLFSATHPAYTYKTYETAEYFGPSIVSMMEPAQRMANALARSMMQTREQVMANVLNRAFDLSPASLEEIEVDIKRGGSTDEIESNV